MQGPAGIETIQSRLGLAAIPEEPVRSVFNDDESILTCKAHDSAPLFRRTGGPGWVLEIGNDVKKFWNLLLEFFFQDGDIRPIGVCRNADHSRFMPAKESDRAIVCR